MDKLKNLTNAELIKLLQDYGIQHGPIVDSTRTLYEKRLYEFERKKKTGSAESSYESRQQYSTKYDENQDDYETYEEETYTKSYNRPQAHQRVREDLRNNSKIGENTYQNISQVRHQSSYSQGVEARKPIRPKPKEEEPKQLTRRFLPLWLQLILLLLLTGFLVYLYCRETNQNPFLFLQEIVSQREKNAEAAN
ncbi:PREDICTED: emerin [Nanorana parkeri]|uniref:emerin n=1 Tax=Nanorana parkeri TaxID=125878 RepID=UPI0008546E83|nr:PREDICTED: emerin [Nanorana parkeri]